MSIFDFILILIVFGFVWYGFWFGFIRRIGGLLGVAMGALLASRFYPLLAPQITFLVGGSVIVSQIVSFVLLYIIFNRLTAFVFGLLDKVVGIFTKLPGLKTINRIIGAFLGLVEGSLTVGLLLFFVAKLGVGGLLAKSQVAPHLINVAKVLLPLLPKALKELQTVI